MQYEPEMVNGVCKAEASMLQHHADAIRSIVGKACLRFEWYRAKVDASRYPVTLNPEDLPFVTDADLSANYYRSSEPLRADESAYFTSGTGGGQRKRVIWSEADHRSYVHDRTRILGSFIGSSCQSACADLGIGHAAESAMEVFRRLDLKPGNISPSLPAKEHLRLLHCTRPDLFFSMPMIVDRIAAVGDPPDSIRKMIVVGDVAPAAWRRKTAARWGIDPTDILDLYGSTEVGSIGHYDAQSNIYRCGPHIVAETVATADTAASTGKSLLVLTSLARESLPVIRYVTGDLVEGFKSWSEGTTLVAGFDCISGREGDDIKHGEKLSLHSVIEAIHSVLNVRDYEIRRNGFGVVIAIDAPGLSEAAGRKIVSLIRAANPSADRMIASGLVGDIQVMPADLAGKTQGAKRRINRVEV